MSGDFFDLVAERDSGVGLFDLVVECDSGIGLFALVLGWSPITKN